MGSTLEEMRRKITRMAEFGRWRMLKIVFEFVGGPHGRSNPPRLVVGDASECGALLPLLEWGMVPGSASRLPSDYAVETLEWNNCGRKRGTTSAALLCCH